MPAWLRTQEAGTQALTSRWFVSAEWLLPSSSCSSNSLLTCFLFAIVCLLFSHGLVSLCENSLRRNKKTHSTGGFSILIQVFTSSIFKFARHRFWNCLLCIWSRWQNFQMVRLIDLCLKGLKIGWVEGKVVDLWKHRMLEFCLKKMISGTRTLEGYET